MKTKSNIIASVKTQKQKFYVRILKEGYAVQRENHTVSQERDLTTAITNMLRMAYFETKQTEIPFV